MLEVVGRNISYSFGHSGPAAGTRSIVGRHVESVRTRIRRICEGEGGVEASGRCSGLLGSLFGRISIRSSRSLGRWRRSSGRVRRTSFIRFAFGRVTYSAVIAFVELVFVERACGAFVRRLPDFRFGGR